MNEDSSLKALLVPLQSLVDTVATQPLLFDVLRWVLEAGFKGEKAVLRQEGATSKKTILDLGCGTGALANMFNSIYYTGIDTNLKYLERAREVHPQHRFLLMDGRSLSLDTGSFDAVVIGGVIHHLEDEDARAILTEVRRVLKPGTGQLVMWEDVPTRHHRNLIGKLVHYLDQGDHIRLEGQYVDLVKTFFTQARAYPMSSGVCDYVVVVAQAPEVSVTTDPEDEVGHRLKPQPERALAGSRRQPSQSSSG